MPLISAKDAEFLRTEFENELVNPVKLVVFTQQVECQFCAETRQIAEEILAVSVKEMVATSGEYSEKIEFDGMTITVALTRTPAGDSAEEE